MNKVTIQISLVFSLIIISTYATNTITSTQILRDNGDTLVSSAGRFQLGFYSPNNNSYNRYVGIWYNTIPKRTVVWVANHGNPLTDASGMLTLIDSRLVLVQNVEVWYEGLQLVCISAGMKDCSSLLTILWSTNTSRTVQTPVATLLDSGNLVVKDADEESFLWQSFEYPTDTFLPGMKLGRNFVTGKEVHITSPKSDVDPTSGDYTYGCDPTGYPQLVVKRGDVVIYRSGPWNGKGFSGAPKLQKNEVFTFDVVMSEKEVYYHFELLLDVVISRFVLSESGFGPVGRRLYWVVQNQEWAKMSVVPLDSCDEYNGCGPYGSCSIKSSPNKSCGCLEGFRPSDPQGWEGGNWSSGCIRDTPLNCREGDGFVKYSGMKLPDTRSSRYNKSMSSVEECKQVCITDCSCMAYTSLDISNGESGCLFWFGDLVDMREIELGQDIHIRMAYNDSADIQDAVNMKNNSRGVKGGNRVILIIVTLCLVVMIGTLLLICLVLYSRKRKEPDHQQETDTLRFNNADNQQDEIRPNKDLELPLFDLATLTKATDSFSLENKLGEGGFGAVYKARLEDGQEVAVKRLSRTSVQGGDEFKNEVMCIAELQHRNLVKLLGCCVEGEEKMLVYEYMTNRSLDLILFDPVNSMLLDWPRRSSIINGIARGVMYLHQDSRLRVIHRDLKASNILLDSNMNPKISDFGLARTFGGDETGANTRRVIGTYGYMSPEYAAEGEFSVKSDVFSYGVLVLEIVSGKRNRWFYYRDRRLNLLGLAWMLHREEKSVELLDPCLRNSCDLWQMIRAVHVGLLCVQELPQDRPSISAVVLMLSNGGVVLPQPKHPGFFRGRDFLKNETWVSSNTSTSTNAVTITLPEAR